MGPRSRSRMPGMGLSLWPANFCLHEQRVAPCRRFASAQLSDDGSCPMWDEGHPVRSARPESSELGPRARRNRAYRIWASGLAIGNLGSNTRAAAARQGRTGGTAQDPDWRPQSAVSDPLGKARLREATCCGRGRNRLWKLSRPARAEKRSKLGGSEIVPLRNCLDAYIPPLSVEPSQR